MEANQINRRQRAAVNLEQIRQLEEEKEQLRAQIDARKAQQRETAFPAFSRLSHRPD